MNQAIANLELVVQLDKAHGSIAANLNTEKQLREKVKQLQQENKELSVKANQSHVAINKAKQLEEKNKVLTKGILDKQKEFNKAKSQLIESKNDEIALAKGNTRSKDIELNDARKAVLIMKSKMQAMVTDTEVGDAAIVESYQGLIEWITKLNTECTSYKKAKPEYLKMKGILEDGMKRLL